MDREAFNTHCTGKPQSTHVVQWGNADVWKVGGKVFAICGRQGDHPTFTFMVSDLAFEVLGTLPDMRPAPYMASRGLKWIQQHGPKGLKDAELTAHIDASYDMIVAGLTQKKRAELGLT